jgi:hypothetical protein
MYKEFEEMERISRDLKSSAEIVRDKLPVRVSLGVRIINKEVKKAINILERLTKLGSIVKHTHELL